jgi:carbamate kinase
VKVRKTGSDPRYFSTLFLYPLKFSKGPTDNLSRIEKLFYFKKGELEMYLSEKARCSGTVSTAWYHGLRILRRKDVSLREMVGVRQRNVTVIAVGGNSIGELQVPTVENVLLFRAPVLTHGNGPQVGKLVVAHPEWTLNQCGRQTQDDIGLALKADLEEKLRAKGRTDISVQVIPTRVIVDANDPAFRNPTKPIGVFYSLQEIEAMGTVEKVGNDLYHIKERDWYIRQIVGAKDPAKPLRRVVASPKPIEIEPEDFAKIKEGAREGNIVIACGGGGVPYVRERDGSLRPVEAVIDKDLASALLAMTLEAREMIISTGVQRVAHNFTKPGQYEVDYFMLQDALRHLQGGEYPAGSMGEKVEAAINALRGGVNVAMITHPNRIWIKFEGTLMTRGWDIMGRMHNLAVGAGNLAEALVGSRLGLPQGGLQRWLVK